MKLHGDTFQSLASYLGMARCTFSYKINETNGAEFTQTEIARIKNKYDLTAAQLISIFFAVKVSWQDTKKDNAYGKTQKPRKHI